MHLLRVANPNVKIVLGQGNLYSVSEILLFVGFKQHDKYIALKFERFNIELYNYFRKTYILLFLFCL